MSGRERMDEAVMIWVIRWLGSLCSGKARGRARLLAYADGGGGGGGCWLIDNFLCGGAKG